MNREKSYQRGINTMKGRGSIFDRVEPVLVIIVALVLVGLAIGLALGLAL